MKTSSAVFYAVLIFIAAIAGRCSNNSIAGGDGTGTGTEVIAMQGFVQYDNGAAAAGVTVYLRDANSYSIDDSGVVITAAQTVTDSNGAFRFNCADTGTAVVEAVDANGNSATLRPRLSRSDTLETLLVVLRRGGLVRGSIGTVAARNDTIVVAVAGYRRLIPDSLGSFVIDLPEGSYVVSVYDQLGLFVAQRLRVDSLVAGETRDLGVVTLIPKPLARSRDGQVIDWRQ